jgi:hypothetical protein
MSIIKGIDMKIDNFKQKAEEPKTYHELKQEDKKEQPSSQPVGKPQYGSVEYELRGIGWNVKEMHGQLSRLGSDLEYTLNATNKLLDDMISHQKETNLLLGDIIQFLKSRFTLNQ